ncbi:hypothetical protein [Bradyrhizobium sp. USDA 329]
MSTLTQGKARRSSARRSRAAVSYFSRARWALRAMIHCSRETI